MKEYMQLKYIERDIGESNETFMSKVNKALEEFDNTHGIDFLHTNSTFLKAAVIAYVVRESKPVAVREPSHELDAVKDGTLIYVSNGAGRAKIWHVRFYAGRHVNGIPFVYDNQLQVGTSSQWAYYSLENPLL